MELSAEYQDGRLIVALDPVEMVDEYFRDISKYSDSFDDESGNASSFLLSPDGKIFWNAIAAFDGPHVANLFGLVMSSWFIQAMDLNDEEARALRERFAAMLEACAAKVRE